MKITRKQAVVGVSLVAVFALLAVGAVQMFPRLIDPYAGMKTTLEVQMDDATRLLVQQKIETAKASIAASEKAGEEVDMNLYLSLAEQYHILGDLVASREAYETYLDLNPASYVAWNAYGTILEIMGDYEKAGPAFAKAVEILKTQEFFRDYAEFLAAHYPEKETEYKAVIDQAYEELGQTPWTMQVLGDWYFAHNDCVLGRDHYEVAQALDPENTNITLDAEEKYEECTKE
jgi:tetratricopeptide (TPR) repeat protein